jgi:hypothetical protein
MRTASEFYGDAAHANTDAIRAANGADDSTASANDGRGDDAESGAVTTASGSDAQDSSIRHNGHRQPDRSLWRQLGEVIDELQYARWRSAEKQLQQYLAVLRARGAAATRIALLSAEREQLHEAVEQLRTDPINQHLQLPPSLFLQSSLNGLKA